MKAVFNNKTKRCVGYISYCRDGEEGLLVGYPQKEITVKELDQELLMQVEDVNNPLQYRDLVLDDNENISVEREDIQVVNKKSDFQKDLDFIFDQDNDLEKRFNKLVELFFEKPYKPFRLKNKQNNGKKVSK
mgnify:CR=1 FL=1|jgi:hypothetical protein